MSSRKDFERDQVKKLSKRVSSLYDTYMAMIACSVFLAGAAYGQATRPNGRVLISPRSTTLLSAACTVNKLQLNIQTGNDDLRGGGNDLNIEIHLASGAVQFAKNVNHSANWPNNSANTIVIPLNQPIAPNQIKTIRLIHLAQGSYTPPSGGGVGALATPAGPALAPIYAAEGIKTEDNWDMAELQASAVGNGVTVPVASSGLHRFTGTNPSFDIKARPDITCPGANDVTALDFRFRTGNDDLRGGKDNLDITIFADTLTQGEANVNHSQGWANGSFHSVTVTLQRPVPIDQIRKIYLETTSGGGSGGDNWNMDSVDIIAVMNGQRHPLATQGFYRFTGPPGNRLIVTLK